MKNQRHLFELEDAGVYLNGAYMSPQLKSVEKIGIQGLQKKTSPNQITASDFFDDRLLLKKRFAKLIDAEDYQSIAIIPSVSYGIATVAKNIPFKKGDEVVVLEEQFPSNVYTWRALEKEIGIKIKTIKAPSLTNGRSQKWNDILLEAITSKTKCVAIPHVHWADGSKFDLKKIRTRTNDIGAYLIIDGTQSVGALPFSVAEIQPDALICGGYKWLMGPYGLGVAYFGKRFYEGAPLENNWMNHESSEDFSKLVHYNDTFKPKAARFDVGESSNFILTPMLSEAIRQLVEWTPQAIQQYCKDITEEAVILLQKKGYFIENAPFRGHHLFGIYLPKGKTMEVLQKKISEKNILVSYRGDAIRVSPNVYNLKKEMELFISCFE